MEKRVLSVLTGLIMIGIGSWMLVKIIDAGGNLAWAMKSFPTILILIGIGLLASTIQKRYSLGIAVAYVLLPNSVLLFIVSIYMAYTGITNLGEILGGFFAMVGIVGILIAFAILVTSIYKINLIELDTTQP